MPLDYVAYGLVIRSELVLPELPEISADSPQVTIRLGQATSGVFSHDRDTDSFCITTDIAYLYWKAAGGFLISDGDTIIVEPRAGIDEQLLRLPLLGIVLAVLLCQRGLLVLHASAVAVGGAAAAFLGPQGYGKSTMAAALHVRGHPLIADDVLAVDISRPECPLVYPGLPQLKLWPRALASTFGDAFVESPRLHEHVDKRSHRIVGPFASDAAPLKSLFALDVGPSVLLSALGPQQSLVTLVRNTHGVQLDHGLLQGHGGMRHFQQCTALLRTVPIHRLERPAGLEYLPEVAHLVEQHCAGLKACI